MVAGHQVATANTEKFNCSKR